MISTREELIDALTEAAELEHGLMLQYLFAALSLKKRRDEGLEAEDQELIRKWEGNILSVARDEMGHLGTVCNLLSAIGAAPRLGRPNFPQPAKKYYPFDFELTRFSDEALYRFVRAELPQGEPPPAPPRPDRTLHAEFGLLAVAPEPINYDYVGQLYGEIEAGFDRIDEKTLFIGPMLAQDTDDWARGMKLHLVKDRQTAKAAIDFIVHEGEGAPANRKGSHYDTFLTMRAAFDARTGLDPARPVVKNPRTREHRDSPFAGTLITRADTKSAAEILNAAYGAALLMLMQYYSYGGETPAQRDALRGSLRQMMSNCIRPVAEVLTELPIADGSNLTAGAPFELYSDLRLSTQTDNRWVILIERLSDVTQALFDQSTAHPRFAFVGDSMSLVTNGIRAAAGRAI